jgi:hypothetical protein
MLLFQFPRLGNVTYLREDELSTDRGSGVGLLRMLITDGGCKIWGILFYIQNSTRWNSSFVDGDLVMAPYRS